MVFADRVEIWNPGSLPPSLTLIQLSQYIERLGTGTCDMIRCCR